MRLLTYDRRGARRLAAWVADAVVDLPDAVGHPVFPATMEALVARNGGTTLDAARAALDQPDVVEEFGVARPRVLLPLLPASICELAPAGEARAPRASRQAPVPAPIERRRILGPGERLAWPPGAAELTCRVQVAAILGRGGQGMTIRRAAGSVFGHTLMADWSRPGDPTGGVAASLGPLVLTTDEIEPPTRDVLVLVDGEPRGEAVFRPMAAPFARLISRMSADGAVAAGDVVGSAGFGAFVDVTLRRNRGAGHVVEVRADGLGVLRTRVSAKSR
jgi:hypothetical protein